jgi:hypothetical protein
MRNSLLWLCVLEVLVQKCLHFGIWAFGGHATWQWWEVCDWANYNLMSQKIEEKKQLFSVPQSPLMTHPQCPKKFSLDSTSIFLNHTKDQTFNTWMLLSIHKNNDLTKICNHPSMHFSLECFSWPMFSFTDSYLSYVRCLLMSTSKEVFIVFQLFTFLTIPVHIFFTFSYL